MERGKDYSGEKYGMLTLKSKLPKYFKQYDGYYCLCDCGTECIKNIRDIRIGDTTSCGCKKHKMTPNPVVFDDKCAYIYITGRSEPSIIDKEDYDKVKNYRWKKYQENYAYARKTFNKKKTITYLHRLVIDAKEGFDVDHINGNPLDNRKCNLRVVTHQQNCFNRKPNSRNKTGTSGVYWNNRRGEWASCIGIDKKRKFLGYFKNLEDAINARKDAEIKYYGEYRRKENEERK